jgi:dephospho-CoA kinase
MISIGLTGNIASGKSTVAKLFRRWGATVIDADQLVRQSQAPGEPVLRTIAGRFGGELIREDGTLDREELRARVMGDPAMRGELESIVHPEVQRRRAALLAEARKRGDRIVVSDIPLLFEAADPAEFDAVVLVDASEAVRRERLIAERGLSPAEADAMIAAQLPSQEKRSRSDYIIDNDDDVAVLERAAFEVWEALLARA